MGVHGAEALGQLHQRGAQPLEHAGQERLAGARRRGAPDVLQEVLALEPLHGEEAGAVALHLQLVEADDVGVGDVGDAAELLLELVEGGGGQPGHRLERDVLLACLVERFVDDTHAAHAEPPQHTVGAESLRQGIVLPGASAGRGVPGRGVRLRVVGDERGGDGVGDARVRLSRGGLPVARRHLDEEALLSQALEGVTELLGGGPRLEGADDFADGAPSIEVLGEQGRESLSGRPGDGDGGQVLVPGVARGLEGTCELEDAIEEVHGVLPRLEDPRNLARHPLTTAKCEPSR